MMVWL